MIRFDHVSFRYPGATVPVLRDVNLDVPEGELCLVIGPTGSGKTTLLTMVNGLAPHFTGGVLRGVVTSAGRDTRTHPPRQMADVVGMVGQNPAAGFVTDTVDDELAYGMEQQGIPAAVMRTRVEEIVDVLGLGELRDRPLADLSGGQQQRVAIGAALTSRPRILVLDEPTSALDPAAAEEVLAVLLRLVQDFGITILVAEHRLERVVQNADSVIRVHRDGTVTMGEPHRILTTAEEIPPLIRLGKTVGWEPLPLSIRDARRRAAALRDALAATLPPEPPAPPREVSDPAVSTHKLSVRHGRVTALADVDLHLYRGECACVMGRSGSGKSSLLWALRGVSPHTGGSVTVHLGRDRPGADPARLPAAQAARHICLVPQNPADLLYRDTVAAECSAADRAASAAPGHAAEILRHLAPDVRAAANPHDLSEGQRSALVLAMQLAGSPEVILLDEPTRGLDYAAKRRLRDVLSGHAARGAALVVATHDVEFAARVAQRIVILAGGHVIADGPAASILAATPTLAPQVARVFHPLPVLTVGDVHAALEGVRP